MNGEKFRTLVVVPAFNEEESVAGVVEELRAYEPRWDVLVIDDGSSDRTAEMARRAGAKVVSLVRNLGIGGAVQTGFLYALKKGYGCAVQCDGDGQHPPEGVALLVKTLKEGGVDVVVGSRFLNGGRSGFLSTPSRRLGISLLALFLGKLCGQVVTDPTSGLRAYNTKSLLFLSRNYPRDYPEPEALLLIHRHGLTFREVAVTMRERRGGTSSLGGWTPLVYMSKVLLSLAVETLRPLRSRRWM